MTHLSLLAITFSLLFAGVFCAACDVPGGMPLPIYAGPGSPYPACAPGFYCPKLDISNSTTWPVLCPPSLACSVQRLGLKWCAPQGEFEPTICPEGWYCPVPGQVKLKCPSGHYCPTGTYQPRKCPWLSICAAGAIEYRQLGVLALLIGVDLLIAGFFLLYYIYRKDKHDRYLDRVKAAKKQKDAEMVPLRPDRTDNPGSHGKADSSTSGAAAGTLSATNMLIEGFHLSRGNQPLLDFDFSELGLSIPGGKKILQGVTGAIRHGQVTAVMGPSGAGKTTFLNTLMGKVDSKWTTEGSLLVNGAESKGLSKVKKLVGYVPQEDVMYRELSVWQNLKYSADIRLPREWDNDARERHVNAVLEVLDLAHVRNSPIGDESSRGISGGQRKRVNIGMELAACPLALFCDEPTSGLDSASSLSVVSSIKKVARSTGMTVVMVIHQPRVEIWNSLDRVLILAPGGITGYLGEQRFVEDYFSQHFNLAFKASDNPADVVMDYVAGHGNECAQVWKDQGEEWLSEHAAMHRDASAEFDDLLANAISGALSGGAAGMRKSMAIPKNESLLEALAQERMKETMMMEEVDDYGNTDGEAGELEDALKSTTTKRRRMAVRIPSRRYLLQALTTSTSANQKGASPSGGRRRAVSEVVALEEAPNANLHVVRGANFFYQLCFAFMRSLRMQYLTLSSFILEMGLAAFAGAVIGFSTQLHFSGVVIAPYTSLTPSPEITTIPQKALYIGMSVGIAAASAGVKTFGEGMPVYWRESSSGHNRLAFYLAQSAAMIPRIALGALHFSCIFQVLSGSYNPFEHMLLNTILIFYAVYGLCTIVSVVVPRRDAPLLAAVLAVVAAVLNGFVRVMPGPVNYPSYAYWSHEAIFTGEAAPFKHIYQIDIAAKNFHVVNNRRLLDYLMMFGLGTAYRIIGMLLLFLLNRDKQR